MAKEIVMPRMGLTMEEGTVVCWRKKIGETVQRGEILLEIETDKVTSEIEAPSDGILGQILIEEGVTVPIGTPIATIVKEGEPLPSLSGSAARGKDIERKTATKKPVHLQEKALIESQRLRASPAARRCARELGIDLATVQGNGPNDRILETDVRRAFEEKQEIETKRITPVAARMAAEMGIDITQIEGSGPDGTIRKSDLAKQPMNSDGKIVELSHARSLMAERMAFSFSTAPHFYLTAEVDASALKKLRQHLIPKIEANSGVRVTYTDLLVFFLAKALKEEPMVNAAWVEGKIQMNNAINIGIATGSERGLTVPVIHSAEQLTIGKIAQKRAELVEKAHSGKLMLEDLEYGTFTLSNLGNSRVDMFNAVLNPPQAAILAVGRIHDKVIAYNDQPAIRPVIMFSLTCDHRVLDGAAGARFLTSLVEMIEEPLTLFL